MSSGTKALFKEKCLQADLQGSEKGFLKKTEPLLNLEGLANHTDGEAEEIAPYCEGPVSFYTQRAYNSSLHVGH